MSDSPAVQLSAVCKTYPAATPGAERRVLDGIDFTLSRGEAVALVGPSGCGKSTLLNLIGTLDPADGGTVKIFGQDVAGLSEKALADLRARHLGFIFQSHHLLPQCSVLENVLVPTLALPGNDPIRRDAPARAKELLQQVGLGAHLDKFPAQLSGGERQRAAVVRALINQPQLLLADEPTGALDRASADGVADLLLDLHRTRGLALLLVTHDLALAARLPKTLRLNDGRLG